MPMKFEDLSPAWQGFVQACNTCKNCSLHESRDRVVIFRGSPEAPLMIIGEGPGKEEDRLGLPFVGRSGRLLDQALTALEFTEKDYHICNIVKCRPPENRTPTEDEGKACRRLLNAQFALVKPRLVLLSGATAFHYFTGQKEAISKARGHWIQAGDLWVMPTFHPAYILRNMNKRDELWSDLLTVRYKMEELGLLAPWQNPLDAYGE